MFPNLFYDANIMLMLKPEEDKKENYRPVT